MQKAWKKNNNTGADYDIQCENLEIASLKSSFTGTSMATTKKIERHKTQVEKGFRDRDD